MDRTKSQDSEGRARIKSETAVTRRRHSVKHFEKSKSFGNSSGNVGNLNRKKSLVSSGNQSIEEERSQEEGKEDDVTDNSSVKRLTNLKDFYSLPGQSGPDSDQPDVEGREKRRGARRG